MELANIIALIIAAVIVAVIVVVKLLSDRAKGLSFEEELLHDAEKHLRKARNHNATAFWANHHQRTARRNVKLARRINEYKKQQLEELMRNGLKSSTEVDESGHARIKCPWCKTAAVLDIGAARERNETAIRFECDSCECDFEISWEETPCT